MHLEVSLQKKNKHKKQKNQDFKTLLKNRMLFEACLNRENSNWFYEQFSIGDRKKRVCFIFVFCFVFGKGLRVSIGCLVRECSLTIYLI